MPYAEHAGAAHRWATERDITCWVCLAGDLEERAITSLLTAAAASRADGACWILVVPPGSEATETERSLVDLVVSGAAPAPWGIFAALQAAAECDARRRGRENNVPRLRSGRADRGGSGRIHGRPRTRDGWAAERGWRLNVRTASVSS